MLEGLGYTVTLLNDEQRGTLAPTFQVGCLLCVNAYLLILCTYI
jgi:hypothetical protein